MTRRARDPGPSPGDRRTLSVVLRAEGDPATVGNGELVIADIGLGRRLRGAAFLFVGAVALAALFLPIPLMHLAGIPIILVGIWLAARRLRNRAVIASARGRCPACGEETPLYVGFGSAPFKLPIQTSCAKCARTLRVTTV